MPGTDKTSRDRRGKSGEGAIPASRDGEKAALSVLDGYSQYLSRPYAALQLSQPPTSVCARYALPEHLPRAQRRPIPPLLTWWTTFN